MGRHAKPGVETQAEHIMEVDTNMAAMVTPGDKAQGPRKQDVEVETLAELLEQRHSHPKPWTMRIPPNKRRPSREQAHHFNRQ